MPSEPRRVLLARLLDAYERGASYGRPAPWPRDVILRIDAQAFPEAFAPDAREELEALRAAAEWLVQQHGARCERAKGGLLGSHISTLRVGPTEIVRAYELTEPLGYEPLGRSLQALAAHVREFAPTAQSTFMEPFLSALATAVDAADLSPLGMRRERLKRELHDVCDALRAACAIARGEVGWERMLSERNRSGDGLSPQCWRATRTS